jgi:hypothetical protein
VIISIAEWIGETTRTFKFKQLTDSTMIQLRSIRIASLLMLLASSCGGADDAKLTCTSTCGDRDFTIHGESGVSTFDVSCNTSFDYPAGQQRITSESCNGTRTYANSGHSYHFTSHWDQVSCRLTLTVDGVGTCSAP